MKIQRITNDNYPEDVYSVYEVLGDINLKEPCFYIAINNDTKLCNIYSIDNDGKPNRIDLTVLKFRTDLPLSFNKEGLLAFNDPENLDKLLLDLLGEHASIITQDMGLRLDKSVEAELGLELTNPADNDSIDTSAYNNDLYAGLDPEVIDVIQGLEGEGGDMGGGAGGGAGGGGGGSEFDDISNEFSDEVPVVDGEEIPPEEEEVNNEP
jgi:hypothetical protein